MLYRVLADVVVLLHTAFVVFVVVGGFLVWRWRWVVWAHVPCALWGIAIEPGAGAGPVPPRGEAFGARAGLDGYCGGFVGYYLLPLLDPAGRTLPAQATLGTLVVPVNVA